MIPDSTASKEAWRPNEAERFGIAFGLTESEIQWAVQTRDRAIEYIIKSCKDAKDYVAKFSKEMEELYR